MPLTHSKNAIFSSPLAPVVASRAPNPPDPRPPPKPFPAFRVVLPPLAVAKEEEEEEEDEEEKMEEGAKKGSDAPNYTKGDRKSRKTALAVWRAGKAVQPGCGLCVAAGLPCVRAKGYVTCARCTGKAVGQARCIRPGPASRASVLSRVKTERVSRRAASPTSPAAAANPVTTAIASRRLKSTFARPKREDEHNVEKDGDQLSKIGKKQHIKEELRTESCAVFIPSKHINHRILCGNSPAVLQPIAPNTTSIADIAPPHDDLTEGVANAQTALMLPTIPHRAPLLDAVRSNDLHPTARPEGAQALGHHAKSNAAKRHGPSTPKRIDIINEPMIGNYGCSAIVKRRKTDIDQLRAALAEERRVMEESKCLAEELRRKADERQRQLNEEWDGLQELRREYKATIEENQRKAEAASKELEDLERANA